MSSRSARVLAPKALINAKEVHTKWRLKNLIVTGLLGPFQFALRWRYALLFAYVFSISLLSAAFMLFQLSRTIDHRVFITAVSEHDGLFIDLLKFYTVGEIARNHGPLYNHAYQLGQMAKLLGTEHFFRPDLAEYTPFFCVAMIPLTLLRLEMAGLVFPIICLSAGLLTVTIFLRQRRFSPLNIFAFCALTISSLACFQNFQVGQIAFLIVALIGLYYDRLSRGKDVQAGILLALSLIKP